MSGGRVGERRAARESTDRGLRYGLDAGLTFFWSRAGPSARVSSPDTRAALASIALRMRAVVCVGTHSSPASRAIPTGCRGRRNSVSSSKAVHADQRTLVIGRGARERMGASRAASCAGIENRWRPYNPREAVSPVAWVEGSW